MEIRCPLTQSDQIEILETFDMKDLIKKWKGEHNVDIEKEVAGVDKIFLCYNPKIKFKFFYPLVPGSGGFYNELQSKFDWYYKTDKWEYDYVLSTLPGKGRLLELGSGSGFFLEKARKAGMEVKGVEYSQKAVEEAQKKGLPVFLEDLLVTAEKEKGRYDVVCSFQVMEHVDKPAELLRASVDLLKPGGSLYICVPNSKSFLKHMFNVFDMPPHHLIRWDNDSLKMLEDLYPVELSRVTYEPLSYEHIWIFVEAYWNYWGNSKNIKIIQRDFFNKRIRSYFTNYLIKGGRRKFRGHTICAQFIKK